MRGSVKVRDHWQNITLSDEPELLSDWLWAHDGREAVCIDDKKQVYYCATEELREKYHKGGKKSLMFWDLELKLRECIALKKAKPGRL